MSRPSSQLYLRSMYYASWMAFGSVGLVLNIVCALLLVFPRTRGRQQAARRWIRSLFDLWVRWFHATGVLEIRWRGFEGALPSGAVWVANHPSLLDATFLLARIPDGFCIFKPALMRNPAIAPAAILAGYETGDRGVETIRGAVEKVRQGGSLLVFPEGTRTSVGTKVSPFRPGFALIALRAGAPIQPVIIRSSEGLVRRGNPWWKPPPMLPAWIEFELSTKWDHDPGVTPADLAAAIEHGVASRLPEPVR